MFSRQTDFPTDPNVLVRRREELVGAGQTVLDLSASNPTVVDLKFEAEWLPTLDNPQALVYEPEPFGMSRARLALTERWRHMGHLIEPSRIALSASTSEAYSHLFKLLCDPGDEVLVPSPSYPLFEHLARLEHVVPVPYRLEYDGRWHIDLDSLETARTARSKALVLVSPNNPTGSITQDDEFATIARLGLPVISDEVFSSFTFGTAASRFQSALGLENTLVFVLDGLSKSLALPQCKLAWTSVSGPEALVRTALSRLEIISDAFLSVSAPIQCALPDLLRSEASRRTTLRERLERNLGDLRRVVAQSPVTLLHLEGGWSAVLQVPNTRSETEWTLELLERGLWVQPGWFFDFAREGYLVVSLLTRPEAFTDGIERLVSHIHARC